LGAMASQSSDSGTRGMGAAWSVMSSNFSQATQAHESANHQNEMAKFQQKMTTVNKPRFPMDEIAKLVQRKADVVADQIFCIAYGSDKILVKPLPFFREIDPAPIPEKSAFENISNYIFEEYLKPKNNKTGAGHEQPKELVGSIKKGASTIIGYSIGAMFIFFGVMAFIGAFVAEEGKPLVAMAIITAPCWSIAYWFIKKAPLKRAFVTIDKDQHTLTGSSDAAIAHLKAGNEIAAIKAYRAETGSSLTVAKSAISRMKSEL